MNHQAFEECIANVWHCRIDGRPVTVISQHPMSAAGMAHCLAEKFGHLRVSGLLGGGYAGYDN